MSRGKRYNGEQKLNMKKVFAVFIAIAVIVMFVFVIKTLLSKEKGDKITNESYFTAFSDNKFGVINSKGEIVIEPSYAEYITIPNSKKDLFICTYDVDYNNNTYKTKALNSKNEEIFNGYEQIEALDNFDNQKNIYYDENCIRVKKDGKYGLINFEGKEILNCEYDNISTLKGLSNSIIIEKDGKVGIADSNGKIVINAEYKEIKGLMDDYKLGYIVVNSDNKYGIVDCANNTVLNTNYEEIKQVCYDGMYIVKENGIWKIINKDGSTVIEKGFDDVKNIQGNNIIMVKGNKYGVISTSGEEILPAQYDDIEFAFTDTFIVKKDNKYGLVKTKNQIALEIKFANMVYIKQADFIEASEDGIETDIIGNDLNVKLTGIISEINIDKGYFRIRIGDQYKYYNFKFEEKQNTDVLSTNTLFLKKENEKYGYTDRNGNIVVDYQYEEALEQNPYGYIAVKKDGKWGSLDKNGKVIVEPSYQLDNNIKIDFIGSWHLGEDINMNYYTK